MDQYNAQNENQLPLEVLDRRWKKLIRLLRTAAFLNDRAEVDLMDCFLLAHGLWNHPQQLVPIAKMLSETIRNHGYSLAVGLTTLREEIDAFETEVAIETKIEVPETQAVLKPYEDAYYKLLKQSEAFEGAFVSVKEFNQLQRGEKEILNLYDAQYKLVNRLQVAPGSGPFAVRIQHNAVAHELQLETYLKSVSKTVLKKPHPLVLENWNQRHQKITAHLKAQQNLLQTEKPAALQGVNNHLFVDQTLAPFVTENFDKVVAALEQLELRMEKLQHYYLHLGR
jgi:MoxR-like ATPase